MLFNRLFQIDNILNEKNNEVCSIYFTSVLVGMWGKPV